MRKGALALVPIMLWRAYITPLAPESTVPPPQPTISYQLAVSFEDLQQQADALEASLRELHGIFARQEAFAAQHGIPVMLAVIIDECSRKYNLPKALILALMRGESDFRERAENTSNNDGTWDRGRMQINEGTAPWLWSMVMPGEPYDIERVYEPVANTHMGCWYLRYLQDRNQQDLNRTLTGYNRGEGPMRELVARTGSAESEYSIRIMAIYRSYVERGV